MRIGFCNADTHDVTLEPSGHAHTVDECLEPLGRIGGPKLIARSQVEPARYPADSMDRTLMFFFF